MKLYEATILLICRFLLELASYSYIESGSKNNILYKVLRLCGLHIALACLARKPSSYGKALRTEQSSNDAQQPQNI